MKTKRTITRQGKSIVIHVGRQACIRLYRKAREHGWITAWTGDFMVCMHKP